YSSSNHRLCIGPLAPASCGSAADLDVISLASGNASILARTNPSTPGTCAQVGVENSYGTLIIGKESTAGGCLGFGGLAAQANVIGNLASNVNTQFFSVVSQASGTGGVSAVSVGAGGTGYTLNDILTLTGGNGAAQVKVTGVSGGV